MFNNNNLIARPNGMQTEKLKTIGIKTVIQAAVIVLLTKQCLIRASMKIQIPAT